MSRGTTLTNLLVMCHNELAYNTTSTTDDTILTGLLNNKQLWYSSAFDWPFLRTRISQTLAAGQRFQNLPALDFERPHIVYCYWNQIYRRLIYGIDQSDYNAINSTLTPPIMVDPVKKWMLVSDQEAALDATSANSYEVWPVPASATQTMLFVGQTVIPTLVAGGDKALLDDLLLVKSVCGDFLTKRQGPDAGLKLAEAAKRFTQLQSAYPQPNTTFKVGEGDRNAPHMWKTGDNIVALAPSS